jgi:hypothetical protein
MIMLHTALRRGFRLLPALVGGVPDADTGSFPGTLADRLQPTRPGGWQVG